jgi:hypothetical protein
MSALFPKLGTKVKHKIDFSLVPIGVILIEFAVLTTQLSKDSYKSLGNLLLLRAVHTVIMLVFAWLISRLFIKLKLTEVNYQVIALTGTVTIAIGDFIHRYLGHLLGVQLVSADRRIGIILLQGCFWFPAFMIIGSKRTEILQEFRAYEQRLVTATRAQSRTSSKFSQLRLEIQNRIESELDQLCKSLKVSVEKAWDRNTDVSRNNTAIQPLLLGADLRKLSMELESFGSEHQGSSFMGQNLYSVNLLIKQFKILYSTTARNKPLRRSTYAIVLIVLVTPPVINYFSLKEALVSFPLVSTSIFISAHFISKTLSSQSKNALRNSSILIYLTGFLPVISNVIGQAITHDPNTKYPVVITAIILPISYYVFIKVLQAFNPYALQLIRHDELKASSALQEVVTKVVSDEFSHTLSHRWAIFIHGKILTRLAATALKLESATIVGDSQAFNGAVESLLSLLENPHAEFDQVPTDLRSEVSSRLDPWIGLLDVDLHIDADLEPIRNPRVRDLGEVIEELVSNSMRHGKAQEIELRVIKWGEKDIKIFAKDNATIAPSADQVRFGLGTRIFNLASDGRWSLKRVGSSTEFELTMAFEQ